MTEGEEDSKQPTAKRQRRVGQRSRSGVAMQPMSLSTTAAMESGNLKVLSKHDEKWNSMLEKLTAYKAEHGNTLVPQCYAKDTKLGRWVHYQRVEYWMLQANGKAKITPERIAMLNALGFEWDPQRHQWQANYDRLIAFQQKNGHSRVPKGYAADKELANWVRNQRLEYANMQKGKTNRMTQDRLDLLNQIGFEWSSSKKSTTPVPEVVRAVETAVVEEANVSKDEADVVKVEGDVGEV